ncbi:MAG: flavin reductase [Stappiaceae bacterium]
MTGTADNKTRQYADMDPLAFREAMSRLGAAVHVVATAGDHGRGGVTISAACSVTDAPPTVLICLNRSSPVNALVRTNGVFCVNTLPSHEEPLSRAFAGLNSLPMEDRFNLADWTTLETGAPSLIGARVSVDCHVSEVTEIGTHTVIFGQVTAIALGDQTPALIYLDRNYHAL